MYLFQFSRKTTRYGPTRNAAIFGTRVLDKEKYKNDEENENVKDKASKTVEYGIFVRAVELIETETKTEKEEAPTATDGEATLS